MSYDKLNPAIEPSMAQDGQGIAIQRLHWWRQAWTGTEAAAGAAIHAAITLTTAAQTITTDITQPSCARGLTMVMGKAEETSQAVVITGTNINGDVITETITSDGSDGTTPVAGTKAFKTITSITVPARKQATTPTCTISTTDLLGLKIMLPAAACVYATYFNGTLEGTAATVKVDSDEIEKNTIDLNSSLNGKSVIAIGYIYS